MSKEEERKMIYTVTKKMEIGRATTNIIASRPIHNNSRITKITTGPSTSNNSNINNIYTSPEKDSSNKVIPLVEEHLEDGIEIYSVQYENELRYMLIQLVGGGGADWVLIEVFVSTGQHWKSRTSI